MAMFDDSVYFTSNGISRSRGLFKEMAVEGDSPVFTLSKAGKDGYVSLRKLYIEYVKDDPSEDTFVEVVFGDWHIWNKIKGASWFEEHYEEWQNIAAVKRKSEAFKTIVADAMDEKSRTKVSSAKYLIEEPWERKTKTQKERTKETARSAYSQVDKDLERLREHLN